MSIPQVLYRVIFLNLWIFHTGPLTDWLSFFSDIFSSLAIFEYLLWKNMSIFVKCQQSMNRILDSSWTKVNLLRKLQISWRSQSAKTVKSQISTDSLGKVKIYKSSYVVKKPNQTVWFLCVNEISFVLGKVILDWILILV